MEVCEKFKCENLVNGECRLGGGECVQEDCPDWCDCGSCRKFDECEG